MKVYNNKPFGDKIKCKRDLCENIFQPTTKNKTKKYCCVNCRNIDNKGKVAWNKGIPRTEEVKAKISAKALGYKHTEESKLKMSISRKGRKVWNEGIPVSEETKLKISKATKGKQLSKEHREKLSNINKNRIWTPEMREAARIARLGEKSHLWKGGVSTLQNSERAKAEYKNWRKEVYKRDNYICQDCGTNKDLHAHHIKTFSSSPETRYEILNGITLCKDCHSKIHGRPIPNIVKLRRKNN